MSNFLDLLSIPKYGLSAVFLVSFLSATLLPLGAEPVIFGFINASPDKFWITIWVATLGNTLGALTNYWIGQGGSRALKKETKGRLLSMMSQIGPPILFFSGIPIIGDPLCVLAGWSRLSFWPCFFWISLGRLLKYILVTLVLLKIPSSFWEQLFHFFL